MANQTRPDHSEGSSQLDNIENPAPSNKNQ